MREILLGIAVLWLGCAVASTWSLLRMRKQLEEKVVREDVYFSAWGQMPGFVFWATVLLAALMSPLFYLRNVLNWFRHVDS